MPINSRAKGHGFERLIAAAFRNLYPKARRGLQYQDGLNCPDVQGTPYHVECKRGRRVNIRKAIEQANRDSGGTFPILVVTKEDNEPIYATLRFDDFLALLRGPEIS